MVEELKRFLRLLTPVDWLAAGVILLGLLIALVLDDAAVRLIGISIALLGAVAFFLLISQRIGEEAPYNPVLRSQAAQLRQTVKQEQGSTRLIFDDFAETFTDTAETATPSGSFSEEISSVRIVGRRPRRQQPQSPAEPVLSAPPETAAAPPPPARIRQLSLPDFVLTPLEADEPRLAFHTLLERLLTLVRVITPTRTIALFWLDSERQLLVLEAWQSEVAELFRSQDSKFPLGHDIVSQIALRGRAEIVTEIQPSAEIELLPYYREPAGTSSFVGVPLFLHNRVVGVLCLDSTQPHAYTATTVSLLGHVVLLIAGLLQSYIQQYELLQKTRLWELARTLWELSTEDAATFPEKLLGIFTSAVQAPVMALCLHDPAQRQWRLAAVQAPPTWQSLKGAACLMEHTLVGEAIYSGEYRRWDAERYRHRLHPAEPPLTPSAHAYAFPLCSPTHAYGALYCETPEPLAPQELESLATLCLWAGGIAEHRYWSEQLRGGLWFYPNQGTWSIEGFRSRIAEELERLRHLRGQSCLCALQLDRYGSLAELSLGQVRELLTTHILPAVRAHLRGCDILGYLGEDTLGVLLPGMELTHAQLWAESLRKHIATSIVPVGERRLSLTLSLGLTELQRHRTAEEAIEAVSAALRKALQKGNTVVLYS